jgi:hypothetical protein
MTMSSEDRQKALREEMERREREAARAFIGGIALIVFAIIAVIAAIMYVLPVYGVWQQRLAGEAELARASQNRQIAQYEATAALQRAEGEAAAEVARARGNAQANGIIADGLGGPAGYLEYLYIQALRDHQGAVIYVPTEAGLPILEAGRRPDYQPERR